MNDTQRQKVKELRENGYGYGKIAQMLGLSVNTIKTYCRRQGLGGVANAEALPVDELHYCLCCGTPVHQVRGRKEKNSVRIVAGINGGMPIWIRLIVKHSIPLCAVIAKSRLVLMVTKIGSIAHMSAISLTDLEVLHMSDEQMKNEMLYQGTMSIAKIS